MIGNTFLTKISLLKLAKKFNRLLIFSTQEYLSKIFFFLYTNMIFKAIMDLLEELDVEIVGSLAYWTLNIYKLLILILSTYIADDVVQTDVVSADKWNDWVFFHRNFLIAFQSFANIFFLHFVSLFIIIKSYIQIKYQL